MATINTVELIQKLEEERDFNITQMGKSFDKDELINLGATIYILNTVIGLVKEIEESTEAEIEVVRSIAKKQLEELPSLNETVQKLKAENHSMQLFIEEHVPEDKKKLIFND